MTAPDAEHYPRIAVIGDIHGDARKLAAMIAKLHERYPDAALFSVGDLNDRGPDTKGVVQLCLDHGIRAVVGNHDQWMRTMLVDGKFSTVVLSEVWGARPVLRSYGCNETEEVEVAASMLELMPETHKAYFRELPYLRRLAVADGEVWITHSGISHAWLDGSTEPDDVEQKLRLLADVRPALLYFGYPELTDDELWSAPGGIQVFGHQGVPQAIVRDGWAAVDTGCGSGRMLSALVYPERAVVTVD